jgi:hypothetical protein
VGFSPNATLENEVKQALKGACLEAGKNSCGPNVRREFTVYVRAAARNSTPTESMPNQEKR